MSGFQESKDGQSSAQDVRTQSGMKKRESLTQERVRELFNYDPESGLLTRLKRTSNRVKPGTIVTNTNTVLEKGYTLVGVDGIRYRLHHVIWVWMTGVLPTGIIDHKNMDPGDNSWSNLREVTCMENSHNHKLTKGNTSGVNGISYLSKKCKWQCRIRINYKVHSLGYHDNFIEAVAHRLAAEQCTDFGYDYKNYSAYRYMQKYLNGELNDKISD